IARSLRWPAGPGRQAALPEVFRLAEMLARPARQDEEQIAEPIDVLERPVADGLDAREREHAALCAPAHRARLVEKAADAAAAGQHEGLEGREVLLALIHQALERRDLARPDAEHPLVGGVGGRRQFAAQIEQLVLHAAERLVEPALGLAA